MSRWAERLNRWGYAALIVDSFGPRGVKTVCGQGHLVSPVTDRTADAYRAALYLRGLATVDPGRLALIGFSHGGGTVMSLVQPGRAEENGARPFRAAVAYYPSCRPQRHGGVDTPLLILIGEKDDWTPARFCQELMSHLRRPELVELKVYPEAYHAFDSPGPARTYLGHFMTYDRAAAEDSFALTREFLARKLN
jgi:dienelactone hydrolase